MIDMEKFPELKSLNRLIISFLLVLGVTFSMVAPFSVVYADEVPYYESINNEIADYYYKNTSYLQGFQSPNSEFPVRSYLFVDRSDWSGKSSAVIRFMYLSEQSTTFYFVSGERWSNYRRTKTLTTSNYSSEYNIYWFYERAGTPRTELSGCKAIVLENLASMSEQELFEYVMETYEGGGSNIDYGDIKDLSYSTSIVGSGTTTGDANIDTISWYPYWDTNDNISTTWNMEIQVVPGTWQGGTNTDIFSQSYQDFIINESGATSIYHGTYLNGSFSISWGEVKNKLSILSWADLFQYFDGSYWNKKGWVYRARFNDPDHHYWSDWQTVYTVTSSTGEGVEKYIDPSDGSGLPDFYNNAVDSYNTTSIVNNINDVTYYYINTPVDTNPSSDDSTQYLKEIRDTIIQIRRMISIDNNSDATPDNINDPWTGNPAAELYDFEDSSINDFNDAVSDLPASDLVTGNKFIAASTWVRTQYETLVSNTPFEAVIIFSLLLGFGLLLIGKLR